MFGVGRPRALDRNAKVRIMHLARCLARRTEKSKAYGEVTAKALAVLEALLWALHNAKSGLCFPSYEAIAEAAHCARSTAAEAIKALEDAGILTWVQRVKRVRERCSDLLGDHGWRWRVLRTSNAYTFRDPSPADRPDSGRFSSKSEKPTGTPNQGLISIHDPVFLASKGRLISEQGGWKGEISPLGKPPASAWTSRDRQHQRRRRGTPWVPRTSGHEPGSVHRVGPAISCRVSRRLEPLGIGPVASMLTVGRLSAIRLKNHSLTCGIPAK
jgi:Helix-turn-helix domain